MRKTLVTAVLAIVVALSTAAFAAAGSSKGGDSVWIISGSSGAAALAQPLSAQTNLKYGSSFKAGYSSRAREPWAYAQCWADSTTVLGTPNQGTYKPGDMIWSGYRSLTGLTGDTFDLNDPIQGLWLGGGASCKLNLVTLSNGKQTVLASVAFTVTG